MALFDRLDPRPADPLLGLLAAFRADDRTDKIDLGVGIYKDDAGRTPIMEAVREAETRLAKSGETKAYEGSRGNVAFAEAIEAQILGTERTTPRISFATPGGCGALSLAFFLYHRLNPEGQVWLSDPTWPNHKHIATTAGVPQRTYPYAEPTAPGVDLDRTLDGLAAANPGDAVLLQGPCHNPTGIDLTTDQWAEIGKFVAEKKLIALIDVAYHGFASSLEGDRAGIAAFLDAAPEALISYSCSKNFGLYRDRAGCLIAVSETERAAEAIATHMADISRALWSMPPAHGPAIVAEILGTADLEGQWRRELTEMRERMLDLRRGLATALRPRGNTYDPAVLTAQNGMFSQLPLTKEQTVELREKHALYIPGSGRINVAGLSPAIIDRVAEILSPYL
ncbi:aspartate aminotransferase [Parvularcula bermudensis HTCC2503]|uniref:Aminotransferase n=2 Tax=Parvularcula TaxID=208215 RepID=E0TGJ9_PARBH|nr:aspartate aminotransferase [Parvularcula bermudensis HTCC2503]